MVTKVKLLVNKILNEDIRGLIDEGYDVESVKRIMHIAGVEAKTLTNDDVAKRAILAVI